MDSEIESPSAARPLRLLLVCDEGHSTSILMQRVQAAAARCARPIEATCDGFRGGLWDERSADVILIAPQVAFLQKDFEKKAEYPVALGQIPRRVFGALDTDAIIAEAFELYDLYAPYRRAWELCEELAPREVLVCCAGGMSSSLLVWHMQRAADEANLHVRVQATGVGRGKFMLDKADCVLIAPQVRYSEQELQDFNDRRIPVGHIPWQRYGRMDGTGIMRQAVRLLEEGGTPPYEMDEPFRARWEAAVAELERVRCETLAERDDAVKRYGRKPRKETAASRSRSAHAA